MAIYFSPTTRGFFDEGIHGSLLIELDPPVRVKSDGGTADLSDAPIAEEEPAAGASTIEAAPGEGQGDARASEPAEPVMVSNPATLIPADAVLVSADIYQELMSGQAGGKVIIVGQDGAPELAERVLPVDEQLAIMRRRRNRALAASDWTRDPDALDAPTRRLWKDHRKRLRDLPALLDAAVARGEEPSTVPFPPAPG